MKKVIVAFIAVLIVATSCLQAQAGRRYHRSSDDTEVLLGVLGGIIIGSMVNPGRGYGYHDRSGYYNYQQEQRAAMQRARRHEQAIQRYENCLAQRQVDIYYGVPPRQAKNCTRYHPSQRNWNY